VIAVVFWGASDLDVDEFIAAVSSDVIVIDAFWNNGL
jgi:hypothetical protein